MMCHPLFLPPMKRFTIRLETYKYLDLLTDEQLGQLFRSLYEYHVNDVTIAPKGLEIVHRMFIDGFKLDGERAVKLRQNAKQPKAKVSRSKQNPNENQSVTIEIRKQRFTEDLKAYLEKYGKDMLNEFHRYWTEPNKSNTKMRFEMEKTWSTALRLENWARKDKSFNNKPQDKEIIIPKI